MLKYFNACLQYKSKVIVLQNSGVTGTSVLSEITPVVPKRSVMLPAALCSPFLRYFGSSSKQTTKSKDITYLKGVSLLDDNIGVFPDMDLCAEFYNWLDKWLLLTKNK